MIGMSSPGNSYVRQGLADFHLDELEQLLVVDLIALVHENNDIRARRPDGPAGCAHVVWAMGPSVAAMTRIAPSI